MPVILVSGFDAWGDLDVNPAWVAVEACRPKLPEGWEVRKARLDVSWDRAFDSLLASWTDEVVAVVGFGVAPIHDIALEQIAINLSEGTDVDGQEAPSREVIPDGPAAYWSTLPIEQLQKAITDSGLQASKSAHAGTYLCNALFYQIIHETLWKSPDTPAGFVHLPNLQNTDSISQADLNLAVETIIEALASPLEETSPI